MKLGDFGNVEFGEFTNYTIEDFSLFWTMICRMVEDLDVGAYILAKQRGKDIGDSLTSDMLNLIGPTSDIPTRTPIRGIVNPEVVRDLMRAPIPHSEGAFETTARFVNFHVANMLRDAANRVKSEGSSVIKLRHILPGCEHWPYPLNRYC